MTIPDEAIEATARAYYEASTGKEWAMLDNYQRPVVLSWIRRALETVAPYMIAEQGSSMQEAMYLAWEQGYHAHISDGYDYQSGNPYRSEPAAVKTSQDTPKNT